MRYLAVNASLRFVAADIPHVPFPRSLALSPVRAQEKRLSPVISSSGEIVFDGDVSGDNNEADSQGLFIAADSERGSPGPGAFHAQQKDLCTL